MMTGFLLSIQAWRPSARYDLPIRAQQGASRPKHHEPPHHFQGTLLVFIVPFARVLGVLTDNSAWKKLNVEVFIMTECFGLWRRPAVKTSNIKYLCELIEVFYHE